MPLSRRDLLKKGALAGVITAGAAALGIANAPAAQAGSNVVRLLNWKYQWGSGIFTWSYAAPRLYYNTTYVTTYWSRSSSYRASYEGDSVLWQYCEEGRGGNIVCDWRPGLFESLNHMNWELDSVVMIQVMLNGLVEQGYLGGSTIAADGSFGNITHYKVGDFQTAKGLTVDGVVGPATLSAMRAQLGI